MPSLRTQIMAIINTTPDSFSDGGRFDTVETATKRADELIAEGADILDIGGESTRPGATPVGVDEELQRVIPIVQAIHNKYPKIPISIDTMKAEVAKQAIAAGAGMINDISACRADEQMMTVAAESKLPIIVMHMQGTPANMQINPRYKDVVEDILIFFKERIKTLTAAGIKREQIILDPGIGFGKRLEHNLSLIKNLHRFAELNQPLLLAHSRKRFLGMITGIEKEQERDFATATVAALTCAPWVNIVRVHDVRLTRQALQVAEAVINSNP